MKGCCGRWWALGETEGAGERLAAEEENHCGNSSGDRTRTLHRGLDRRAGGALRPVTDTGDSGAGEFARCKLPL